MTSTSTERSLSDIRPPAVDATGMELADDLGFETADATEPQTPETFDLQAFVAGVRPTRRSVKLYPAAHLLARMDELVETIQNAPEDEDVDHLIDEFEACKRQYLNGVTFVIEARSSDWEREFRKTVIKQLGVKVSVNKSGDLEGPEDQRARIVLHQLAAQIVQPAGVTYAHLASMTEANQGEVTKLLTLQRTVNQQIAESADVLRMDFSRRRSGKSTTRGQ